jgi:HSP20 family protein
MTLPVLRRSSQPAATARWDPFAEFEDLYDRMGRLMDSVWGGFGRQAGAFAWSPLADVSETEDAYVVDVDLPGVKRDQVDVEVTGSELVITGEVTGREREGVLRRATRRQGRFEYRTTLPGDVDPDKISASLADGVLTVTVPKAAAARPRRIEITAG